MTAPASSKKDPSAYIRDHAEKAASSEIREIWNNLETLYSKRLWHQLTVAVLEFVKHPEYYGDGVELYENFISDFETKINPLTLVEICTPIWVAMTDKEAALKFIEQIGEKVKTNQEAFSLTRVIVGTLHLEYFKRVEETKKIIEEVDGLLHDIKGVGKVHARFYYLASDFYKQQGNHEKYYRASLHYLGCTDLKILDENTRRYQAFHLGLAAILGTGIYNFGELLAHPILESLKGSEEEEWLVKLLYAFNCGDVAAYEALRPRWMAQPDLSANQEIMFEKLCLLSLMEMAFKRVGGQDRILTFADISETNGLPLNQVEFLVMKALAQGLVKGSIDQVDSTVNITWVQPRVLDIDQLNSICSKIKLWTESISSLEAVMENNAADILTM